MIGVLVSSEVQRRISLLVVDLSDIELLLILNQVLPQLLSLLPLNILENQLLLSPFVCRTVESLKLHLTTHRPIKGLE